MEYKNGDRYEGSWKSDVKDGQGEMIYVNGETYSGLWLQDKEYHDQESRLQSSDDNNAIDMQEKKKLRIK